MRSGFGVYVPQGRKLDLTSFRSGPEQFRALCAVAQEAERLGFDALWLYDHLQAMQPGGGAPDLVVRSPVFEAWSLLPALAVLTSRIRLGPMVTCSSYRSPSLLAKMASMVDVMSGGRLDLGLGAGWHEAEYRSYGYPFPPTGERLDRLEETIEIVKRMWTEPEATYSGRHHWVQGAVNEPKPVQEPHPPIWVGGGGERRTLRLAALHADGANFSGSVELVGRRCQALEDHCRRVGRDYGEITKSINLEPVIVHEDEGRVQEIAEAAKPDRYRSVAEWAETALIGTPDQCVERIRAYQALGVTYFVCYFWGVADDPAPLRLFAEAVVPACQQVTRPAPS